MERLVTDAIVLSTAAYGEADRLVTLFTADLGRVAAFAAHARRSLRRFSGALDPFTWIRASLVERRGGNWRLDTADVVDGFPGIREELRRIALAGYAVELVRELCRDREQHPELFAALRGHLARLAGCEAAPADRLRFELAALAAVGLSPRLDSCTRCGRKPSSGDHFDAAAGGLVCSRCAGGPSRAGLAGARYLLALQRGGEETDPRARAEARGEMDEFIRHHLGARLKSVRFMAEVGVE